MTTDRPTVALFSMRILSLVEAVGFAAIACAAAGFGYLLGGALAGVSAFLLIGGAEAIWFANAVPEASDADDS